MYVQSAKPPASGQCERTCDPAQQTLQTTNKLTINYITHQRHQNPLTQPQNIIRISEEGSYSFFSSGFLSLLDVFDVCVGSLSVSSVAAKSCPLLATNSSYQMYNVIDRT